MSLYNWSQNSNVPTFYGTENSNYTRDSTTDSYQINTRLPYNSFASIGSVDEAIAQNGTFYGTAPGDVEAEEMLNEWSSNSFNGLDVPSLLDLIIELPAGMRTSDRLSRTLRQFPLGLLSALLKKRILERGFSIALYHQFFYSGRINRIINDPVSKAVPIRSNPDDPESPFIIQTRVERDISSIEDVYNFPIAKFELDIPSVAMDPLPNEHSGDILSHLIITPGAGERVSQFLSRVRYSDTGRLIALNLQNYLYEVTKASGGSDISFFLFGENGHITKRFEVFHDRNNSNSVRRARSIRTAGLRQVLLDDYESSEFQYREGAYLKYAKLFVPGGKYNCFFSCIRWSYVRQKRNEHVEKALCEMELAQDYDMLTTTSSLSNEPFDELECHREIEKIIKEVVLKRSKQTDSSSTRLYLKRYRNGFTTIELNEISSILYYDYGIETYFWRIDEMGRWLNIIQLQKEKPTLSTSTTPLVMFQLDDQGEVMNVKKAKERTSKEKLLEGLCDGSLGYMTHAISVYPIPKYFIDVNHLGRKERNDFCQKINDIGKPYFEKIYSKIIYDPDINMDLIRKLIHHQNVRYIDKETRTLIFDLPNTSSRCGVEFEPEQKKLCFGINVEPEYKSKKSKLLLHQMNEREYPRVWVFAYDLETVRNTGSIQNRVYEPFRKEASNVEAYDLQDCQIPFSFQYIGVNVDDSGNFFRRKISSDIKPLVYPCNHPKYECFLTESPRTVYGEHFLLGECVEEALCEIANYVHSHKGEQAFLYAVNGSKFDSLIAILYHRFEMVHILKTSRGVLTVSLRVPIVKPPSGEYDYSKDDNPKITIKLRDISLLVPGSLARLCKGFDVPKEFCKLDFPIQMVNGQNCYHPSIRSICESYGENDVLALGWIIKKINDLIGNSIWNPCEILSDKPPLTQFVTCMGMIRKSTKTHFDKYLPQSIQPKSIDVPALRQWLCKAAIGGRVNAFAKTYSSTFTNQILKAYVHNDREELKRLYETIIREKQCMQCLDVTSLYPFVMNCCPIPMGGLHAIDVGTCNKHIDDMHCDECDLLKTLCKTHHYQYFVNDTHLRPFSIIIVKNIRYHGKDLKNLCPRKTYTTSNAKNCGLVYSLESNSEYETRYDRKETLNEVESFTNIDLYWMRRQGYNFEIVGGFSFNSYTIYNTFIGPAFKLRIEAKKSGNKLLSDFMKLNYNGAYGITIQQDILDSFFIAKIDRSLHNRDPRDPEVRNAIYANSQHYQNQEGISCSEELTGEAVYFPNGQGCFQKKKKIHLAEYFSEQSPMQIGAAILAYARHVGNLIMFNLSEYDYTYTDTDSFTISQKVIDNDSSLLSIITNSDEAPLGSLKNDHNENNGTEPRIFLSLIGGKKVKAHFTINKEGEVKIFNTFKGLHVSCDIDGKKINPNYAEYVTSKVLVDMNVKNHTDPVIVQSWKRNLQHGVSISNHIQVVDPNSYFDDHIGVCSLKKDYGNVEYFIPHGATKNLNEEQLKDFNPVITDSTNGSKSYLRERDVSLFYDAQLMVEFVNKYYEGCDKEYNPGSEEYQKILETFQSAMTSTSSSSSSSL